MRQSETFHGNLETPALLSVTGISARFCENSMVQPYFGEQVIPFFDEAYYLRQFPDVAAAVANGAFTSGWEHFRMFGVAEGRVSSPFLDLNVYRANNPDLADAGLTSDADLMLHFYVYGRSESRIFVNESVFDWEYYLEKNPDLAEAGISSREMAQQHFLNYGINEGRITHPDIEGASYIDKYPDLAAYVAGGGSMGGQTDKAAIGIFHYLNYGWVEGRELGDPQPGDPVPVPPAPPVDDSPAVSFSVFYDSDDEVVSFGGNASGPITMTLESSALRYVLAPDVGALVFSRGGITASNKPGKSDVSAIQLEDGVTLKATADVASDLLFQSTGVNQSGRVEITGAAGAQTVRGSSGDDAILGGGDDDSLKGEGGDDTLDGGDGSDTLDGGDGDDTLTGGAGNDTFFFKWEATGVDQIEDFTVGDNSIDFESVADVKISNSANSTFDSVAFPTDGTSDRLIVGFNALTGIIAETADAGSIATAMSDSENSNYFLVNNGDVLYVALNVTDLGGGVSPVTGTVIAKITAEALGSPTVSSAEITPIVRLVGVDVADLTATNFADCSSLPP